MTFTTTRLARVGAVATLFALTAATAYAAGPRYRIVDLGVVGAATASQGFAVSPDGAIAVGRDIGPGGNSAFASTRAGGSIALASLAGRPYAQANGVNAAGMAVGTASSSPFGSGAVPVAWSGDRVAQYTLPEGQSVGRANAVNAHGVAVGSVGSDYFEYAAIYDHAATTVITAQTATGQFMTYADGINDAGLVVGAGADPHNAAVTVALVYDAATGAMTDIGSLPGDNGGIAFAVGNGGHVVGSSSNNGYPDKPFIWTSSGGMAAIPLPPKTTEGMAYAVNENGWTVGIASGLYAVPFLYVDGATYTLQSLLPANSDWDLHTNTSSSARGIGSDGTIVGTGMRGGLTHAYAMILVRAN